MGVDIRDIYGFNPRIVTARIWMKKKIICSNVYSDWNDRQTGSETGIDSVLKSCKHVYKYIEWRLAQLSSHQFVIHRPNWKWRRSRSFIGWLCVINKLSLKKELTRKKPAEFVYFGIEREWILNIAIRSLFYLFLSLSLSPPSSSFFFLSLQEFKIERGKK